MVRVAPTDTCQNVFAGSGEQNEAPQDMIVTIDCGGQIFRTYLGTLRRIPKTRLWRMAAPGGDLEKTRHAFLDKNPDCFAAVLEFHRSDWLERPISVSENMWMEALNFYNISTDMFVPKPEEHVLRPSAPAWKVQMWDFFEDSASSIGARSFSIVSLLVVVIASVFFVLETMPEFGSRAHSRLFTGFEAASIAFFTAEYFARLACTAKPRAFVFSILNLVDVAAILPFYISLVLGGSGGIGVLRVVRLTRIVRLMRISRFIKGLQLLMLSLKDSSAEVCIMFLFLFIGVLLSGSFMYITDSENPDFDTIPKGLWFSLVTLTTVGYGDRVPDTSAGKFIASVSICLGLILMTGPVAVMATNFGNRYHEYRKLEERRNDAKQHSTHLKLLAQWRGRMAFAQSLEIILAQSAQRDSSGPFGFNAGNAPISVTSYRRFMQEMFRKFDADGSGAIDFEEVQEAVITLGVDVNAQDLRLLFDEADVDQDGALDIDEFTRLITQAAMDADADIPQRMSAVMKQALVSSSAAHISKEIPSEDL